MALLDDISRLLLRELSAFERELLLFPDDQTVWQTVPGVTNSAGSIHALNAMGSAPIASSAAMRTNSARALRVRRAGSAAGGGR